MGDPPPKNPETAEALPPPDPSDKKPRRPRVKHVSSRFMSPFVSSSHSAPDPHPSDNTLRRISPSATWRNPDGDPLTCSDHNRPDLVRRADTPFPSNLQAKSAPSTHRRRVVVKLFKENGNGQVDQSLELPRPSDDIAANSKALNLKLPGRGRPRIDTPIVGSRPNLAGQHLSRSALPSGKSAATKLILSISTIPNKNRAIQQSGPSIPPSSEQSDDLIASEESSADNFTEDDFAESETCSISSQPGTCDSPPIPAQKSRGAPDVRSSMPETDRLSVRYVGEGGQVSGDQCRVSASPCYRSMNSALSMCQQSLNYSKYVNRSAVFSNSSKPGLSKTGTLCLPPPHPAHMKPGIAEARKGKCESGHVEDVHAFRLLYNRYLQWRFANAKAETSLKNQKSAAEELLYTVMEKVSNKREVVVEKRKQLAQLKMTQTLCTILDTQMPHLDEWSFLEREYIDSLSGISTALLDTATRLPIAGDIRVDVEELGDILHSMSSTMNTISSSVECFTATASGMNNALSNLAEVVSNERALIEGCHELLSNALMLQVEESSLRGQLIQLKRTMVK